MTEQKHESLTQKIIRSEAKLSKEEKDAKVSIDMPIPDAPLADQYREKADQSDAEAQFRLAVCHEKGIGVEKDPKEAVKFYKLSAKQKYKDAQIALVRCHQQGIGVPIFKVNKVDEDYYSTARKAAKFYLKKSADDSYAAFKLGLCYFYGEGLEQDIAKGLKLIIANADYFNLSDIEDIQLKAIVESTSEHAVTVNQEIDFLNTRRNISRSVYHEPVFVDMELSGKERKATLLKAHEIVKDISSNSYDSKGERTLLIHLITNNFTHLTRTFLRQHQKNLDLALRENKWGGTPLHWAVQSDNCLIIQELLTIMVAQKRLDLIDARDKSNSTPLMLAVANKHLDAVKLLCKAGADLTLTNEKGNTALDLAKMDNLTHIVSFLESFSTSKESKDSKENSAEIIEQTAQELIAAIKDDLGDVSDTDENRAFLKQFFSDPKHTPEQLREILKYVDNQGKSAKDYATQEGNTYAMTQLSELAKKLEQNKESKETSSSTTTTSSDFSPASQTTSADQQEILEEKGSSRVPKTDQPITPMTAERYEAPRDKITNLAAKLNKEEKAALIAQYREKADKGNAEAQYNLAVCYFEGIGVAKDGKAVFDLCKKAADQKYAPAQTSLGVEYRDGLVVPQDYKKAVELFELALTTDPEYSPAQGNLGVCYHYGNGVTQNTATAFELFSRSAAQGDAGAQYNLGIYHKNGISVPVDRSKAIAYYRLAAKQKLRDAQLKLVECHKKGIGVPVFKNDKAAADFYLTVKDTDPYAAFKLGLYYYYQNIPEGLELIRANADYIALSGDVTDEQLKTLGKLWKDIETGESTFILSYLDQYELLLERREFKLNSPDFTRPATLLSELALNPLPKSDEYSNLLDRLRILEARILSLEIKASQEISDIIRKERIREQHLMEVNNPRCIHPEDLLEIKGSLVQAYLSHKKYSEDSKQASSKPKPNSSFYQSIDQLVGELKEEKDVLAKLNQLEEASRKDPTEKDFYDHISSPFAPSPLDIITLARDRKYGAGLTLSTTKEKPYSPTKDKAYALEANICFQKLTVLESSNPQIQNKYFNSMIKAASAVEDISLLSSEVNDELEIHFGEEASKQRYMRLLKLHPENAVLKERLKKFNPAQLVDENTQKLEPPVVPKKEVKTDAPADIVTPKTQTSLSLSSVTASLNIPSTMFNKPPVDEPSTHLEKEAKVSVDKPKTNEPVVEKPKKSFFSWWNSKTENITKPKPVAAKPAVVKGSLNSSDDPKNAAASYVYDG